MNRFHRRYCASRRWAARVENSLLPWGLSGVDLGTDVLEVGPGLGVTTRVLAKRVPRLAALEIDEAFVDRLRDRFGETVRVAHGDGTAMPFPDESFTGVVCFTMLHHLPSESLQDRFFAEACRVLRPGGVFAGTDSRLSLRFRLIHLFDTMTVIDPTTFSDRLEAAGFTGVRVTHGPKAVRFAAHKPLLAA